MVAVVVTETVEVTAVVAVAVAVVEVVRVVLKKNIFSNKSSFDNRASEILSQVLNTFKYLTDGQTDKPTIIHTHTHTQKSDIRCRNKVLFQDQVQ